MKNHKIVATLIGLLVASSASAATIEIFNADPAGVGFNDTTPATPVGGNAGTTVGEQRLIAYRRALDLWGATLESDVTIIVQGSFARLNCTPTGGTLAQAGATFIFSDFPDAPLAGHWYGSALADAISGLELAGEGIPDIIANFNGDIGQPDCIAGPGWYYGLDNNAPAGQTDFLNTFMHEVSHGLGFQNFANEATGTTPANLPDVYMANTLDLLFGEFWNTTAFEPDGLTAAFIRFSATNTGNTVWAGPNVTANAAQVLGDYQGIRLTGTLSGEIVFGTAGFGAPATPDNFGGEIVIGDDGVGVGVDGCEPLVNDVAGKIAFVDRGACGFTVKALNAQNAGATGVVIGNNQATGAIGLGGSDPNVTIPAISVSLEDATAIKAASPGVSIEFFTDPTRLAGTNQGFVRLYAPAAVALGSSISHFDTVATPNLLMEPFISADLRASANLDLTPSLMQDIGWNLETLKIGSCDTGVPNALVNGELLSPAVEACAAGAKNHGQFVSCLNKVTNTAKKAGYLTGSQKGAITSCAAKK